MAPIEIDPLTGAPIITPPSNPPVPNTDFAATTSPEPTKKSDFGVVSKTGEVVPLTPLLPPPAMKPLLSETQPRETVVERAVIAPKPTKEKMAKLDQITTVEKQYNGKVSDIPVNHPYWMWLNQHRGME